MCLVVVAPAIELTPDSVWYPALRTELTALGHEVRVVRFPNPTAPDCGRWLEAVATAVGAHDPADTVLVGHSLGGVTILRFLAERDPAARPFAGVVLVATMAHEVGYDALAPFFRPPLDWSAARRGAAKIRALVAADDPVLVPTPFEHVQRFVTDLGATGYVTPDGGHFPSWSPDVAPELPRLPQALALTTECIPRGV